MKYIILEGVAFVACENPNVRDFSRFEPTSIKTFKKYMWPSIDVTRKSVEETAASIIKIHEIYLNNAK